jgi:hypothetical protein
MTDIQIVFAAITVVATVLNIYFAYNTHRSRKPVLDIRVSDLPPYSAPEKKTVVILKNVGTAPTSTKLEVLFSCSWMPSLSYKLNLPIEDYKLDPNEEITWQFRTDGTIPPNSQIVIKANDLERKVIWERHEQIS